MEDQYELDSSSEFDNVDDEQLAADIAISTRSSIMESKAEMAPLFYFLASSLNVELVYIILKSLT